jgi:hypothetical protein
MDQNDLLSRKHMSSRNIWTEEKIVRKQKAGDGQGVGKYYKPWISVTEISSSGRSRKVFGHKTERVHHLLSDVEHNLFLALEWQPDIVDIREQYPLPREATLAIAQEAKLRHPHYPAGSVPTVMTVDFLVTKIVAGEETLIAFNAKRTDEAEEIASLEKLEIQRRTLAFSGIEHHLVYHSDIPLTKISNIKWVRTGMTQPGEESPDDRAHWQDTRDAFLQYFQRNGTATAALNTFCGQFDEYFGLEPGSGLRAAKELMFNRTITVDLSVPAIARAPVNSFYLATQHTLRAMGGY